MRVLLFGGSGMLGTEVRRVLYGRKIDWRAPTHEQTPIEDRDALKRCWQDYGPFDAIFNCAGLRSGTHREMIVANALGPLSIAEMAHAYDVPFIHVSTDCVFDPLAGRPHWSDRPCPSGPYGLSKLLGEPTGGAVIVRTSFIGATHGLLRWLLDQPRGATVNGWKEAWWSGSTAAHVAEALVDMLSGTAEQGIEHLTTEEQISKYDLLRLLNAKLDLGLRIVPVNEPRIYRGLEPTIILPPLEQAIDELAVSLKGVPM